MKKTYIFDIPKECSAFPLNGFYFDFTVKLKASGKIFLNKLFLDSFQIQVDY